MSEVTNNKRDKAPDVKVSIGHKDMRAEMLAQLNKENPDFVHAFQNVKADENVMQSNNQEFVRNNTYNKNADNSEIMKWRMDGIARTPKYFADKLRAARTEASAETVEETYCRKTNDEEWDGWKNNSAGKRVHKAKDPNEIGNEGGM